MDTTVLLTLGRLPKALDLARGFAALGCRVVVAEPFGRHLARMSRSVARTHRLPAPNTDREGYLAALATVAAHEDARIVVPVSEETMHAAGVVPLLLEGVRFCAPDQATLVGWHDKLGFIDKARALGLDVPATAALGTPEAEAIARGRDHVVKPVFSSSGHGVELRPAGAGLPARGEPTLVQERLGGVERSTFTFAHEGRALVTVVYRGAVMSGTVAVCFERVEEPAVTRWVEEFCRLTNWSGFVSFDMFLEADGRARPVECNPRITSGIHFVESADLARAILDPANAPPIRLRPQPAFQQFWPCLTEVQTSVFRPGFGAKLRRLVTTPDVSWAWRDPLPLLTMPVTSWTIMRAAMFEGLSFGEASTRDIGWYA